MPEASVNRRGVLRLEVMVPLSDHEQQLLEQMEQALYAEDPKFASVLQGRELRLRYRRRMALAVLGFLAGIALLMTGLVAKLVVVSAVGFVVMLVSVLGGISAVRGTSSAATAPGRTTSGSSGGTPVRAGSSRRGFMSRFEERWQRRRDDLGH